MSDQKSIPVHATGSLDLSKFELIRVLDQSSISKIITIEARFKDDNKLAVIRLERAPLSEANVLNLLCDRGASVTQEFANDIYGNYFIVPELKALNSLKAVVIHPADDHVITKYTRYEKVIIEETPDEYERFVKPYVCEKKLGLSMESIQWVVNILNHVSELDRILYEDADKSSGFIMLPDLKCTSDNPDDLYLLAICHANNIKSVRDLNHRHLPLLKNILDSGREVIEEKFGVRKEKLRVYVHYQPSFYHFHVHFRSEASGETTHTDRDNLLNNVINNISLCGDFYQRATLTYPLSKLDPLYAVFCENRKSD
ncbi:m7GpppX diphosphatase, partial [Fragariocoptes setiger]